LKNKTVSLHILMVIGFFSFSIAKIPFNHFGRKYTLASKEILQKRLSEVDSSFLERTKLIEKLADQTRDALFISKIVEHAIHDYTDLLTKVLPDFLILPTIKRFIQQDRHLIYKNIFQDHQEALQELQRHGIYRAKTPPPEKT
jgi:hypothetical protein